MLTSADLIPEADARKASDVAPTETKSRNVAGDGRADVVKEPTVPRVTSLPTPTTEAAPGPAKDVTVSDDGAMDRASATLVSPRILSLHPLRGGEHKTIVNHRG